jgi:hypothetical protein
VLPHHHRRICDATPILAALKFTSFCPVLSIENQQCPNVFAVSDLFLAVVTFRSFTIPTVLHTVELILKVNYYAALDQLNCSACHSNNAELD